MVISPDVFKQDAVKLLDEAEKWVDKMLTQYSNVGRNGKELSDKVREKSKKWLKESNF